MSCHEAILPKIARFYLGAKNIASMESSGGINP
jgi:hypothetical protein